MKVTSRLSIFILLCLFTFGFTSSNPNQTILGKWKTIDDETKKPSSIIEIYEVNVLYPTIFKNLVDGFI